MKYKKNVIAIIVAVIALIGLTAYTYIAFFQLSNHAKADSEFAAYQRHYVLIADNTDEELWNSIYKSAVKEAQAKDAYVEMLGVNPSSEYSMLDYLTISEASHVDGILICPDGSKEVSDKITEITAEGIPVVTMMQDVAESGRISYIGINSYEIGLLYESIISQYVADNPPKTVMILQDNQNEKTLLTEQIKAALNEKLNSNLTIKVTTLQKDNTFEAEEKIRDIFLHPEETPDILICLNGVDSECASQAAVDLNMVGDVVIVGYYTSEEVISSIKKGILTATISLGTNQLGQAAVDALWDYQNTGYTNEYVCIDLQLVDMKNIGQYGDRTGAADEE